MFLSENVLTLQPGGSRPDGGNEAARFSATSSTSCSRSVALPAIRWAGIEDVRRLGNEGDGDLGDLLVFFATGNHAFTW